MSKHKRYHSVTTSESDSSEVTGSETTAPDAAVEQRPGNPKEHEPRPVPNAHWTQPELQSRDDVEILREPSRQIEAATFGTEHQPSGVSGMIRRRAYEIPDYKPRRWLLLVLADRVEKLEVTLDPRKPRNLALVLAGVAATAGYVFFRRPRRSIWRLS